MFYGRNAGLDSPWSAHNPQSHVWAETWSRQCGRMAAWAWECPWLFSCVPRGSCGIVYQRPRRVCPRRPDRPGGRNTRPCRRTLDWAQRAPPWAGPGSDGRRRLGMWAPCQPSPCRPPASRIASNSTSSSSLACTTSFPPHEHALHWKPPSLNSDTPPANAIISHHHLSTGHPALSCR